MLWKSAGWLLLLIFEVTVGSVDVRVYSALGLLLLRKAVPDQFAVLPF